MKRNLKELAIDILEEFTNCYSEADEDVLARMLEPLQKETARAILDRLEPYADCCEELKRELKSLKDEYEV